MYKSEESVLFNSILNRLYFNDENDKFSLELMVNGKCDLKCKYCYINKFGDKLFPNEIHKDEIRMRDKEYKESRSHVIKAYNKAYRAKKKAERLLSV